jgi:hypothetical protein
MLAIRERHNNNPRTVVRDVLVRALEGKPKARVQIWLLNESDDLIRLASQLHAVLIAAGWPVEKPSVIPQLYRLDDASMAIAAGGEPNGITVVGDPLEPAGDDGEDKPSFNALFNAIRLSVDDLVYGNPDTKLMPLPEKTLRVVIAEKPEALFANAMTKLLDAIDTVRAEMVQEISGSLH